jgi:predicted alpha/beta hydrolase family esterase
VNVAVRQRSRVLFVDGWHGPDPGDWQELWAAGLPGAARVEQRDWHHPERDAWVARLDETIAGFDEPPVLIGHSLGALTVAHWVAAGARRPVAAAMLVTPADVERHQRADISGFAPIPTARFPFPTLLVASDTDAWMTPERARHFAECWGARFTSAGAVGHLTVDEGFGHWPPGLELLEEFLASADVVVY